MQLNIKPKDIHKFYQKCLTKFKLIFYILAILTIYFIVNSPDDYQQSNAVKIMYIHVPSAWLALLIYSLIAFLSLMSFIAKSPLFSLTAISLAPIGAVFAFITLITGSIWGKPIWGSWWVWDARLTSMLILFFLYVAYIALYSAYDNHITGSKIAAGLALIGFINIPIVKFSVDIWHSLHQPASIIRSKGIAIDKQMLLPLFSSFFCLTLYSLIVSLTRLRSFLLLNKNSR
ncbi:MAG: heme ABC transporter permease CcmC [Rickettsiales bacterium]